mmetsp:Transcript_115488/g.299346  ORF Transcript_115488/g.299346 Transcript_115488/m.299346 type:complete len:248 (-) Transcript_115488:1658-2401(-)
MGIATSPERIASVVGDSGRTSREEVIRCQHRSNDGCQLFGERGNLQPPAEQDVPMLVRNAGLLLVCLLDPRQLHQATGIETFRLRVRAGAGQALGREGPQALLGGLRGLDIDGVAAEAGARPHVLGTLDWVGIAHVAETSHLFPSFLDDEHLRISRIGMDLDEVLLKVGTRGMEQHLAPLEPSLNVDALPIESALVLLAFANTKVDHSFPLPAEVLGGDADSPILRRARSFLTCGSGILRLQPLACQ